MTRNPPVPKRKAGSIYGRVAIVVILALVGFYFWLKPRTPEFNYKFLSDYEPFKYGISPPKAQGSPAYEFSMFTTNEDFMEVVNRIHKELKGWELTDLADRKFPKRVMFSRDQQEVIVTFNEKPYPITMILVDRPLKNDFLNKLRVMLFADQE